MVILISLDLEDLLILVILGFDIPFFLLYLFKCTLLFHFLELFFDILVESVHNQICVARVYFFAS